MDGLSLILWVVGIVAGFLCLVYGTCWVAGRGMNDGKYSALMKSVERIRRSSRRPN